MKEYVTNIEYHLKRSAYPISIIIASFVLAKNTQDSNVLAYCAVVLFITGVLYFAATAVSAYLSFTKNIESTWLQLAATLPIFAIYLSLLAAGLAHGVSVFL
jgi:hypothetical protein